MGRKTYIYTTDIAVCSLCDAARSILLIRRAEDPFMGKLALPGGHVEDNDLNFNATGSANAAVRELKEETGLFAPVHLLELLTVLDGLNRDPRGPTVSVVYYLYLVPEAVKLAKAQSDAKEIVIRELSSILPEEMAFDHYKVIETLKTDKGWYGRGTPRR